MIDGPSWVCDSCGLRIGYLPGREPDGLPPGTTELDGALLCLGCRRRRITEAAEASFSGRGGTRKQHVARALIRDELERRPDRPDSAIAKSLGAGVSASAVRQERAKLSADA